MSGIDEMPENVKRMRRGSSGEKALERSLEEMEIERRIVERLMVNMRAVWYTHTPRDPNLVGLLRNREEIRVEN